MNLIPVKSCINCVNCKIIAYEFCGYCEIHIDPDPDLEGEKLFIDFYNLEVCEDHKGE